MNTDPSGVILGARAVIHCTVKSGIVLLGDALVVPGTLFGIRRAGDDQADDPSSRVGIRSRQSP